MDMLRVFWKRLGGNSLKERRPNHGVATGIEPNAENRSVTIAGGVKQIQVAIDMQDRLDIVFSGINPRKMFKGKDIRRLIDDGDAIVVRAQAVDVAAEQDRRVKSGLPRGEPGLDRSRFGDRDHEPPRGRHVEQAGLRRDFESQRGLVLPLARGLGLRQFPSRPTPPPALDLISPSTPSFSSRHALLGTFSS